MTTHIVYYPSFMWNFLSKTLVSRICTDLENQVSKKSRKQLGRNRTFSNRFLHYRRLFLKYLKLLSRVLNDQHAVKNINEHCYWKIRPKKYRKVSKSLWKWSELYPSVLKIRIKIKARLSSSTIKLDLSLNFANWHQLETLLSNRYWIHIYTALKNFCFVSWQ